MQIDERKVGKKHVMSMIYTVKQVFLLATSPLAFRSKGHPLMWYGHYTMVYPDKHQPIDHVAHALPLQQHLKI